MFYHNKLDQQKNLYISTVNPLEASFDFTIKQARIFL